MDYIQIRAEILRRAEQGQSEKQIAAWVKTQDRHFDAALVHAIIAGAAVPEPSFTRWGQSGLNH